MNAEVLEKVFEPYYTTSADKGGSGLGMGIIQRLVEHDLEGSITVSSEPGQGVEVVIRFPSRKATNS